MFMIDTIFPKDQYNTNLIQDVFPTHWKNPQPAPLYDLAIMGGGPGGMTATTLATSLGARVALIENEHLGGECLNFGCIPSKAFLRSSRLAADVNHATEFGIEFPEGWQVNFPAVMERVRRLRSTLSPHDSAVHFQKLGGDIFLGNCRFIGPNALEVEGQRLNFKKAIITTGNQLIQPQVPGLEEAGYLTNETVFNLTSLPPRMAFIGAGPVGCELSQAFARYGSQVTMTTDGSQILPKEDEETSKTLQQVMEKEGMQILLNCQLQRVERRGKTKVLFFEGNPKGLEVDEIFVSIGRMPLVQGIGLEQAGVTFDRRKGVLVNDQLVTSNPAIYGVGNVSSPYKFTHVAKELGKIAVMNALTDAGLSTQSMVIPWCTYTDPEIAHTGMYEKDAQAAGIPTRWIKIDLATIDRAILDGETIGFIKLLVNTKNHRILGATLMARHAGEMISELTSAIVGQLDLATFANTIHPFPTQSEIIRRAAEVLQKDLQVALR